MLHNDSAYKARYTQGTYYTIHVFNCIVTKYMYYVSNIVLIHVLSYMYLFHEYMYRFNNTCIYSLKNTQV